MVEYPILNKAERYTVSSPGYDTLFQYNDIVYLWPNGNHITSMSGHCNVYRIIPLFCCFDTFVCALCINLYVADMFPLIPQLKESLKKLMMTLGCTYPWFVRCIIPNEQKTPGNMTVSVTIASFDNLKLYFKTNISKSMRYLYKNYLSGVKLWYVIDYAILE